jgi:hypothetical protein
MKRLFWQAVFFLALLTICVIGAGMVMLGISNSDVAKSPERIHSEVHINENRATAELRWAEEWTRIEHAVFGIGAGLGLLIVAGWAVILAMEYRRDKATARQRLHAGPYGYELPAAYGWQYAGLASVEWARASVTVPQTLHYAPQVAGSLPAVNDIRPSESPLLTPGSVLPTLPTLPTAPAFADILAGGWRPTMGNMLLGYNLAGPLWGSIDDLLSTLVIGRPGTGKSTLERFLLVQLLYAGAELAILDPHGSIADVADLGSAVRWRAETAAEIDRAAVDLGSELDRRLSDRRAGRREFRPLLVLVDEWNILAEMSKPAVEMARRYILEARKVRGYAVVSGQSAPAASFGDSVARDGLSSRYVLWTSPAQARVAGLDSRTAREMMAQLASDPRGRAVLARASADPLLVAIPRTEPADLAMVRTGSNRYELAEPESDPTGSEGRDGSHSTDSANSTDSKRARAITLLAQGKGNNAILEEVWGVKPGGSNDWKQAAGELRAIIADLARREF